jgi:hypothetical protein
MVHGFEPPSICKYILFGGGLLFVLEIALHRIVHGLQPGRVVRSGLAARHGGGVREVAEGHDVLRLVLPPLHEASLDGLGVKTGVVGLRNERHDVIALVGDHFFVPLQGALAGTPLVKVLLLLFGVGQLDFAHHHVTRVPGLSVEHVEGILLALHAEVHNLGVPLEEDAVVQLVTPQAIGRLQAQFVGQKWEVMLVARA